eukprot:4876896-Prymnesium_polylepis.1
MQRVWAMAVESWDSSARERDARISGKLLLVLHRRIAEEIVICKHHGLIAGGLRPEGTEDGCPANAGCSHRAWVNRHPLAESSRKPATLIIAKFCFGRELRFAHQTTNDEIHGPRRLAGTNDHLLGKERAGDQLGQQQQNLLIVEHLEELAIDDEGTIHLDCEQHVELRRQILEETSLLDAGLCSRQHVLVELRDTPTQAGLDALRTNNVIVQ